MWMYHIMIEQMINQRTVSCFGTDSKSIVVDNSTNTLVFNDRFLFDSSLERGKSECVIAIME